jgi:hypothetical protein
MKALKSSDSRVSDHYLLTPKQVAQELAVSEAWVRDHVSGRRKPVLPHVWVGDRRGLLRFRRADLDTFIQANVRNDAQ